MLGKLQFCSYKENNYKNSCKFCDLQNLIIRELRSLAKSTPFKYLNDNPIDWRFDYTSFFEKHNWTTGTKMIYDRNIFIFLDLYSSIYG